MKNKIELIILLLMLALSISLLAACDLTGIFGSLSGDKEADVTLISKTMQMTYKFVYAADDADAKTAAALFKSRLSDDGFPASAAIYPSDAITADNEILFGNTDRKVSQKAQKLLERKSKSSSDDYRWVFYYKDGKLAIVANCPFAYELALEKFFDSYANSDAITIKSSLKEHNSISELDYQN